MADGNHICWQTICRTKFGHVQLDHLRNIPDKFRKKSDQWSWRRCVKEIVTVVKGKSWFLRWPPGGHISRRTGIIFMDTYLGVEQNSYMQNFDGIPPLVTISKLWPYLSMDRNQISACTARPSRGTSQTSLKKSDQWSLRCNNKTLFTDWCMDRHGTVLCGTSSTYSTVNNISIFQMKNSALSGALNHIYM